MMQLLGAVLVILSGWMTGFRAAGELGRAVRRSGELRRFVDRMYTEICLRRRSLPETLRSLQTDYPGLFPVSLKGSDLTLCSFPELWDECVRAMGLPASEQDSVRYLGKALSAGEDPERAFSITTRELEDAHALLCTRKRERARLYVALGTAGGFLAAVLLL